MQSSKQFLIDRILEQALLESSPLTEIEIRMLKFTEATSASKDLEAAEIFERDYNDDEYEEKIASLIQHAYERDKRSGDQGAWDIALARVAGRDMYMNVLIDRAKIEKIADGPLGDWRVGLYILLPWVVCAGAAALVAFSQSGARVIRSDALRLLIAICLLGVPYMLQGGSLKRFSRRRRQGRGRA